MRTLFFKNAPVISSSGVIVSNLEKQGKLGDYFDCVVMDEKYGEKSFENAERKFLRTAIQIALERKQLKAGDIDLILSGDLMNQIISSSYAMREFDTGFAGMYGACSTMALSMIFGALLVDSGHFKRVIASTCSHFASAERLFRFPLELGNQRTPTSQWTVTAAGASLIESSDLCKEKLPRITCATFGKVVDFGVTDANNMGAAMAPAARETILTHLKERNVKPDFYDLILTGDLGYLGSDILYDLMNEENVDIKKLHNDCGMLMFEKLPDCQGGSGAGCSAAVLNAFILKMMSEGKYKKVLFLPTGALLSTTTVQQMDSIPSICHAVSIEIN